MAPSTICNSIGPASAQAMEEHGLESGGGKVADVFTHSPVDSLAKAMEPTKFLGYETTEVAGKVVGIIAQDHLCEAMRRSRP